MRRGDAICRDLRLARDALPNAASEAEFGDYLGAVTELGASARSEFAGLPAPNDAAGVRAAILAAMDTSLATSRSAAEAAATGDTVTAGDLLSQSATEERAAADVARDYGFKECAGAST